MNLVVRAATDFQ